MKKILALLVIAPLLISCSGKKSEEINEAWIKDTNGFDILMGQFAHNIENIWGLNEVLIAGPKDYVKYTDQYQTRSHINFDTGAITIETIATTDPAAHLRQAIISTLLMGDDPGSIDLYSDANDIQISKEPFLYGQVLDNKGAPIRWEWRLRLRSCLLRAGAGPHRRRAEPRREAGDFAPRQSAEADVGSHAQCLSCPR